MLNNFIDTLHDPAVRDLAWVIGAPGLLDPLFPAYQAQVADDAWCRDQLQHRAGWLSELDLTPQSLHQFITARPTRRLGHYFELLIQFWLSHNPDTKLIASNLQVQNQQRTLGEYDLLFSDASTAACHWEAAVKFYLQVEPLAEQRVFIGPGTQDRLDLKLGKVFQHQLLLGQTTAGQQALPDGLTISKAQAYIKGYLFYHATNSTILTIPGISADHLSGWWIRHTLEKLPLTSTENRWIILPRLRWLAPALLAEDADVLCYAAMTTQLDLHFGACDEAVLVFEMSQVESGQWREQSRGFVVCKTWPIMEAAKIFKHQETS